MRRTINTESTEDTENKETITSPFATVTLGRTHA